MSEKRLYVDLRRIEAGQMKAVADVTVESPIGDLTVKDFRVIKKANEDPWVAFPSTRYEKNGENKNKYFLSCGPRARRELTRAILAEFEKEPDEG